LVVAEPTQDVLRQHAPDDAGGWQLLECGQLTDVGGLLALDRDNPAGADAFNRDQVQRQALQSAGKYSMGIP